MPEVPEGQPDSGQDDHGSPAAQDPGTPRSKTAHAEGAADAPTRAEVVASEPAADGFDQPASDESDGESDSDGGVQARDPPVHEEDDFDSDGMRRDRPVQQIRPGTIPVYDVRSSPVHWKVRMVIQGFREDCVALDGEPMTCNALDVMAREQLVLTSLLPGKRELLLTMYSDDVEVASASTQFSVE